MSLITRISKTKRVESLVKNSIEDSALTGGFRSVADQLIVKLVRSFTEKWSGKYFDPTDDRKVAGLVLAYMMEIAEIGVHHVNDHGYALLKLSAEVDLDEFKANNPRTFEFLKRINMIESPAFARYGGS
jgi:hypothetical protein